MSDPLFSFTTKIDMTRLNAAMDAAQAFSRKAPADALNFTAYMIAKEAGKRTPYVTISTIDADLSVTAGVKIGKRGKPIKGKQYKSGASGSGANPEVSLAVLIIQAEGQAFSDFNRQTGHRWFRQYGSPWRGRSRAAGAAAMAAAVHALIANRHRTPHLLQAGFGDIKARLRPFIMGFYSKGYDEDAPAYTKSLTDFGSATRAQYGTTTPVVVMSNDVGMEGKNSDSNNRALWEKGAPALQAAVDSEADRQWAYAVMKSQQAELQPAFDRANS